MLGVVVVVAAALSCGLVPASASAAADGITWTSRTSAADNEWSAVAYGNGLFVAVARSGVGNRVMTSPDGINWTARASASDNDWYSVTYGNGLFVAVARSGGAGNRVMTSPDGITWTSRASAADNGWITVTYGNGLFVAVASTGVGNRVMTSPDGITWTSRTSAANNAWTGVTYGNGLFVAVSWNGAGNRVMTSPDGINWTLRTSAANNQWLNVTYGNGLFVAVSDSGTGNRVMTSPDGITWTSRASAADNNWWGVTYGNGLFVAVAYSGAGNRVMTSPDGITWTTRASAADNAWFGVTYANGAFVAVGGGSGVGNRVMTNSGDLVAPDPPTISSGPADGSSSAATGASFAFSASDAGGSGVASYECRLDGPGGAVGAWATCTSPRSYTSLAEGAYTFNVRAIDGAANTGAAATRGWTVDTTAPSLTLTAGPAAVSNDRTAAVAFASSDPTATFTCALDDAPFTACSSPHGIVGLAEGGHRLTVRATDPAANTTTETATWTVDITAPKLAVDTIKAIGSGGRRFDTKLDDTTGVTLECQLNGGRWRTCPSSLDYTGLPVGTYKLLIRAIDVAGNASDPQRQSFTIKGLSGPRPTISLRNGKVLCPRVAWNIDDTETTTRLTRNGHTEKNTAAPGRWSCRQTGTASNQRATVRSPAAITHSNRLLTDLRFANLIITPNGATSTTDLPAVKLDASAKTRVLIRLWCRKTATTATCPKTTTVQPTTAEILQGRTATVVPRVEITRRTVLANPGTNTINLKRLLPTQALPAGTYKLTLRITGKHGTSTAFLYRYLTIR